MFLRMTFVSLALVALAACDTGSGTANTSNSGDTAQSFETRSVATTRTHNYRMSGSRPGSR